MLGWNMFVTEAACGKLMYSYRERWVTLGLACPSLRKPANRALLLLLLQSTGILASLMVTDLACGPA
jgi:hypothetical protein